MQDRSVLVPGTLMRHFKGNLYQIVAVAVHSETREEYVVYQALYGDYVVTVRPLTMFLSEVDHVKYPDVKQQYRFEVFDPKHQILPVPQLKTEVKTNEVQMRSENMKERQETDIQANLLTFLDARSYQEKLEVLGAIKNEIDEQMVNSIAMSLDLVLATETVEEQIDEIRNCLTTHVRFEDRRLR
ncbi:DUF1653 domain-containing protein [Anaerosporobacter faecicola]|uniref:DUF1653 domain-containing protein n=1 Tax=Anaerosporobacter faecicola TaxID=2718714 RepID=UPI001438A8DD|nr:DUF1653 domain-containing protein [Anaerosporobacter faecicola]